ncbi:hypothetical protein CEP88_14835 [Roseobacter denitrificans]|uniref:hypothetical protein n=1 Tax=Roseobacter denitrificans TaxID=2434 RepID=UPI000316B47B|nr:hypothetical protein [Roseobacter denitrificans]AVL53752.1 hypothetical protein CEP88_14835 [Roseobacter denitrificans]SFG19385.1 hypothetical protein SAMN05443635_109151 [Roseobacter denitrificans OCh 114]
MFATSLSHFWSMPARTTAAPEPPRKRSGPVFIGDAVQPWGGETLLLALLRKEVSKRADDP